MLTGPAMPRLLGFASGADARPSRVSGFWGWPGGSRVLPAADLARTAAIPDGRLRVLMVISRPAGARDVGCKPAAVRGYGGDRRIAG